MDTDKINIRYACVSTMEQVKTGYSIEFQQERIKEQFEIKYNEILDRIENYELSYNYIDITISKGKGSDNINFKVN